MNNDTPTPPAETAGQSARIGIRQTRPSSSTGSDGQFQYFDRVAGVWNGVRNNLMTIDGEASSLGLPPGKQYATREYADASEDYVRPAVLKASPAASAQPDRPTADQIRRDVTLLLRPEIRAMVRPLPDCGDPEAFV